MASTSDIATRLNAKRTGDGRWQARCPAHDDRQASLTVTAGADGRTLIYCHANCDTDAVLGAMGWKKSDLYPDKDLVNDQSKPKIVARYPYYDAAGTLAFEAVRLEPKSFRQRRPDGKGGWIWNLNGIEVLPYNMAGLSEAKAGSTIYVVEGEKDCDALKRLGLTATTNPMGAGKWGKVATIVQRYAKGRHVVVLPDNDKPGRDHAQDVAESLRGVALSVRILQLPGLPEKGDVSDWLAAGGTAEKLAELVAKIDGPPELEGINCDTFAARIGREREQRVELVKRIVPYQVRFLDDGLGGILPTDLVLLTAMSGAGKTQMAMGIAEAAAFAGLRPTVLGLEADEGEYERRIKFKHLSRLYRDGVAARGVDPGRFISYREWFMGKLDDVFAPYEQAVERDLANKIGNRMRTIYRGADFTVDHIERVMVGLQDHSDLFIIDHLHFIDLADEKSENAAIKAIMKRVRDMVLRLRKPVILVAHLRKANAMKPMLLPTLDDIHGSSDIVKIATQVVALGPARGEDIGMENIEWHIAPTFIRILKDRLDGAPHHVGLMAYDKRTGSYDGNYYLGQFEFEDGKQKWKKIDQDKAPPWAKGMVRR